MNKEYWEKFYKGFKIKSPSSFARFSLKFIPKNSIILDLGCGNGRDSYFFAKKGFKVIGIDYAYCPKNIKNAFFIKTNFEDFIAVYSEPRVIYTRFFIHSITDEQINKLLKWGKGLFLSEFRSKEDKPLLYTNHVRNFVDENKFLEKLLKQCYKILYYCKSKGLAKLKKEDPLIVRIIAER